MIAATEPWVRKLAIIVAALGGIALVLLAILSGINILGRAFIWAGLKPIKGDVEIMEAGIAFAVTTFMPWCQLQSGHASVEIVADQFGKLGNSIIDLITDCLLTGVAILLVWRHYDGMLDKMRYGETTFILQFPLWWSYAACLLGMAVWILVGFWTILADIEALSKGRRRNPASGAVH